MLSHLEITMPEASVDYVIEHVDRGRCDIITLELSHDLCELVQSEMLLLCSLVLEGPAPDENPTEEYKHSLFA